MENKQENNEEREVTVDDLVPAINELINRVEMLEAQLRSHEHKEGKVFVPL